MSGESGEKFVASGDAIVKVGEWQQFLTKLNNKTSTWGGARFKLGDRSQLSQLTNMTGGDFAYIINDGTLWYYNAFEAQWQKVGIVLS